VALNVLSLKKKKKKKRKKEKGKEKPSPQGEGPTWARLLFSLAPETSAQALAACRLISSCGSSHSLLGILFPTCR